MHGEKGSVKLAGCHEVSPRQYDMHERVVRAEQVQRGVFVPIGFGKSQSGWIHS